MKLRILGLLAAASQTVHAFSDTSPFFLFSTSELLFPSQSSIQSATSIISNLQSSLDQCPSHYYILVSQDGVSASDFSHRRAAPSLSRSMLGDDTNVRSSTSVSDVVGRLDLDVISSSLEKSCGTTVEHVDMSAGFNPILTDSSPRVEVIKFAAPAGSEKADALLGNDAFLTSFISNLPSQNYTVIYTTTPSSNAGVEPEKSEYEMDTDPLQEPMHIDLKREIGDIHHSSVLSKRAAAVAADGSNFTLPDGALFNRYQYLTPGLFMCFLVLFFLGAIAYVGIRALVSLEVSYAAFDRDTGPQSQAKKQQ